MQASLMGDRESFKMIGKSKDPKECKNLGRKVCSWNEELWSKFACAIAKDVIFAKFSQVDGFRERLLNISKLSLYVQIMSFQQGMN